MARPSSSPWSARLRRWRRRAGAGRSAPPPTAVKTLTLKAAPIEDASEFIATVRSLRSTTVQPEVEGHRHAHLRKAGGSGSASARRCRRSTRPSSEAAVSSTEANRAGTEADVQYWRLQVKRLASLLEAGAVSKAEFDQAQKSLRTAEARLTALERPGARGTRRAAVLSRHGAAGGHGRRHASPRRATGSRPRR